MRLVRKADRQAPWHPGRCAALIVDGKVIGHAGELHPTVVSKAGLPQRTCAVEFNLDALVAAAPRGGEVMAISSFPVAKEDVAWSLISLLLQRMFGRLSSRERDRCLSPSSFSTSTRASRW